MAFVGFTYPGIGQGRRFHLTIGHGNTVVFDGEILPQFSLPAVNGTLTVTDGAETLVVPGCRLDTAHLHMSTSGHIIHVRILGPTWHWKLGHIDGVYNARRPNGSVDPVTRRTTQQLAALLFNAMAVPAFDVSGLPNVEGPEVNWHGANAYAELTHLCHAFGCDFGLDVWGPTARIWRIGFGGSLPSGGRDMSMDYGIDIAEPPDAIKLYCGPTLFQSKLKLTPVMEDVDGSIVHYEDVSYNPLGQGVAGGWDGRDPNDPLGPPDADLDATELALATLKRRLAKKTYLKYFLATSQANGSLFVPGYGTVSAIEDILPLYPFLADAYSNAEGHYYQRRAFIQGTFAVDHETGTSLENAPDSELLEVPFRVDREKGLVILSLPVHKHSETHIPVAPDLYLTTSYHVRSNATLNYVYHSQTRVIASNGTGTLAVHRPDMVAAIIASYDDESDRTIPTSLTTNEVVLTPEINAHLDSAQAEFQTSESLVKWYIGIMPITLSGTVRQTTFFGSVDTGCFTIAALNTEWEPGVPWRRQRRLQAEVDRRRVRRELDEVRHRRVERKGVV